MTAKNKDSFSQVNYVKQQEEAPIMTPRQLKVWNSGYINGLDEAAALLEMALHADFLKDGKSQLKER